MQLNLSRASAFAFLVSAGACQPPQGTLVKGTFEDADTVLVAKLLPDGIEYIDTLATRGGSFSIDLEVLPDQPEIFMFERPGGLRISIVARKGERITLKADKDEEGYNYTIRGSEESARILAINQVIGKLYETVDTLNAVSQRKMSDPNFSAVRDSLNEVYRTTIDDTRKSLVTMLRAQPGSMTNMFIFPLGMGQDLLINPVEYLPLYDSVAEAMTLALPGNKHVERFNERVVSVRKRVETEQIMMKAMSALEPGAEVADIEMTGTDGRKHRLSELKGKVVLVDFWASWCRPCRQESPFMVALYDKYKGKGLEILSISLDGVQDQPDAAGDWIRAIEEDGLKWPLHLSDLQGWSSLAVRTYGFGSIPFTLLVDREGKLIEKGLRGEPLEQAIQKSL
ncbi:redoxin domain-containing protein [bacterium]|nr:redoxin domain-containing protein [bacterium]